MEEKEKITENQPVKTNRQKLMERQQSRHKDRDFSEDDSLEGSVLEELDDYDGRIKAYDENSKRMNDLFAGDPRSAAFLNAWAGGENPLSFMVRTFGPELAESMNTEEGQEMFLKAQEEWLDKRAKDKELEDKAASNFDTSMETLDEWRKGKNLSEDEAVQVFMKIHQVASEIIEGIYTKEAFDMAYKSMNYDNDVAKAKEDGEVNGRNEKIRAKMKETASQKNMPPTLGGQGAPNPEEKKEKKVRKTIFGTTY